jgi:hypothetical protein
MFSGRTEQISAGCWLCIPHVLIIIIVVVVVVVVKENYV